jgi:hypothetical protein
MPRTLQARVRRNTTLTVIHGDERCALELPRRGLLFRVG